MLKDYISNRLKALKEKGLHNWVIPLIISKLVFGIKSKKGSGPVHILLSVVDHFEPFNGDVGFDRAQYRMKSWQEGYRRMADKYSDADGKKPQHTWFYPPHLDHCFLEDLVSLCKDGYGDVEMHLHHNHMYPFPDTSETLTKKILKCIDDYSKYGIFCLPDGTKKFAFVHGDWSLDNSGGSTFCGVNNEIQILKECGCYADFTFPSLGRSQPSMINTIYYAKDNPHRPKSYNRGKELKVGGEPWGDLLMVPGIIGLRWKSRTHLFKPSIEASNLDCTDIPFPKRIDYLVNNAIRVKGNLNCRFIKLHTHGAREDTWDVLFGNKADEMYQYLDRKYNDRKNYILHYVTAREMYNIIKALEAEEKGDPNEFRDYLVPPYQYLL
jgi:hypothetical protein